MEPEPTEKQQFWSERLRQAEDSGHSLAEYARLHNIPVQKLYQWRSTLRKQDSLTEVTTEHQFTRVVSGSSVTPLSLHMPDAQLRFATLPDPAWLAHFLRQYSTPA